MVCTLVSGPPSTPVPMCPIRESWLCGWGRDELKVVLRQGCISAAETTWPQSDSRHVYMTMRVQSSLIQTPGAPSKDLHLWLYHYYLKHQANLPPTGSTRMCDSWFAGRCRSVNAPRETSLIQDLKNATGGEVGVILPQAPQPPLVVVGADPSLPRSTLVCRILP